MLKRAQRSTQHAWVMLETLLSMALLFALLTVLYYQNQAQQRAFYDLQMGYEKAFQSEQIDVLRRIRQDEEWLSEWIEQDVSPNRVECRTCRDNELTEWAAFWLLKGDK